METAKDWKDKGNGLVKEKNIKKPLIVTQKPSR